MTYHILPINLLKQTKKKNPLQIVRIHRLTRHKDRHSEKDDGRAPVKLPLVTWLHHTVIILSVRVQSVLLLLASGRTLQCQQNRVKLQICHRKNMRMHFLCYS